MKWPSILQRRKGSQTVLEGNVNLLLAGRLPTDRGIQLCKGFLCQDVGFHFHRGKGKARPFLSKCSVGTKAAFFEDSLRCSVFGVRFRLQRPYSRMQESPLTGRLNRFRCIALPPVPLT